MSNDSISDIPTAEDITALEEAFLDLKTEFFNGDLAADEYKNAKRQLVTSRSAYRTQEELAGNRSGFVGGEAVEED